MTDKDLRILCAEALGWTFGKYSTYLDERPCYYAPGSTAMTTELPDPLHSIADALALVDSIKDLDSASMLKSHGEWTVWLFTKDEMGFGPSYEEMEEGGFKATDPDFCRAVTLAFLKLHGKIT